MQQAESAGHISHTMNIIQDITSQTSSGTMATARSIGELSEMAAALQESVTGFKVTNDDDMLLENEMLDTEERYQKVCNDHNHLQLYANYRC